MSRWSCWSSPCVPARPQVRETQALILAPTRELAGQIQKVAPPPAPPLPSERL